MKTLEECIIWGQTYAAVLAPSLHNSSINPKSARAMAVEAANNAVEDFKKARHIATAPSLQSMMQNIPGRVIPPTD